MEHIIFWIYLGVERGRGRIMIESYHANQAQVHEVCIHQQYAILTATGRSNLAPDPEPFRPTYVLFFKGLYQRL